MSWRSAAVLVVLIAGAIGAWVMFAGRDPPRLSEPAAPPSRSPLLSDEPPAATPSSLPALPTIRPRAVSAEEDDPTAAPIESAASPLLVTVVDSEGNPVPGAVVCSCPSGWAPFPGFEPTGQDGTARLILRADDTHVVVTALSRAAACVPITNRESMRVVLGGEVTLRGTVLVDGAPPGKTMRLTVRGFDDRTDSWPEPARELIGSKGFGEMRLPFETDASGAFAVRGPALGAQVTVEIPEGYRFRGSAEDSEQREVAAVCDGQPVLIDVVARTAVTGRVVSVPAGATSVYESPTGRPLDIEIRYVLKRPAPHAAPLRIPSHERRRPVQPLLHGRSRRRRHRGVEAATAPRSVPSAERIATSKDLGDIEIGAPANATFRITDPAGNPIEKARVVSRGRASEPTDSDGRTTLGIVAGTQSVVAGASGFRIMSFALPVPLPDPVELRLERSVKLVVRVRTEDPKVVLTGVDVALAYRAEPGLNEAMTTWEFSDVRISRAYGAAWDSENHRTDYYPVSPGQDVVVSGFKAGDELEVRIEDKHHHVLAKQGIKLRDEETHPVELVVKWKPQTVRGTVLGEMGQPILGAQPRIVGNWSAPGATPAPMSPATSRSPTCTAPTSGSRSPRLGTSSGPWRSKTVGAHDCAPRAVAPRFGHADGRGNDAIRGHGHVRGRGRDVDGAETQRARVSVRRGPSKARNDPRFGAA